MLDAILSTRLSTLGYLKRSAVDDHLIGRLEAVCRPVEVHVFAGAPLLRDAHGWTGTDLVVPMYLYKIKMVVSYCGSLTTQTQLFLTPPKRFFLGMKKQGLSDGDI